MGNEEGVGDDEGGGGGEDNHEDYMQEIEDLRNGSMWDEEWNHDAGKGRAFVEKCIREWRGTDVDFMLQHFDEVSAALTQ